MLRRVCLPQCCTQCNQADPEALGQNADRSLYKSTWACKRVAARYRGDVLTLLRICLRATHSLASTVRVYNPHGHDSGQTTSRSLAISAAVQVAATVAAALASKYLRSVTELADMIDVHTTNHPSMLDKNPVRTQLVVAVLDRYIKYIEEGTTPSSIRRAACVTVV